MDTKLHSDTNSDGIDQAKVLIWAVVVERPWKEQLVEGRQAFSSDFVATISHPVNELRGHAEYRGSFLEVIHQAMPDLERRVDLFFAGHWDGRCCGGAGYWVTIHGHFVGKFTGALWGIEPHGQTTHLRVGEFYRVEDGKIVEARIIVDLVDLARQTGRRILPPAKGHEHVVPGPSKGAGILVHRRAGLVHVDLDTPQSCLLLVEQMISGLGRFDGGSLQSMGMRAYWDPDMMWYGPGGIGTTRSIEGFEAHHQKPFLAAIPDRKGGNHRARIGEDPFAASTGWPSIHATSTGPYLGIAPSFKPVTMRVMDWWRMEGNLLKENWVLIDLPNFFLQLGVDLLQER